MVAFRRTHNPLQNFRFPKEKREWEGREEGVREKIYVLVGGLREETKAKKEKKASRERTETLIGFHVRVESSCEEKEAFSIVSLSLTRLLLSLLLTFTLFLFLPQRNISLPLFKQKYVSLNDFHLHLQKLDAFPSSVV